MQNVVFISLLLIVFSFKTTQSDITRLSTRELLPNTGYWRFLPILGLPGRVAHFLVTDTEGFGNEIKKLDGLFKKQYGTKNYVELERDVVESMPWGTLLVKGKKMMHRVREIRDPKTGKTLGHALDIISNVSSKRPLVKEFVRRWGMVENLDGDELFGKRSSKSNSPVDYEQLRKMKLTLLEHPETYAKLMSDPEILSRLSSTILQSLQNVDFVKGIDSAEKIMTVLRARYPEEFQSIVDDLYQIKDEKSGISFGESLATLANIIRSSEFRDKIQDLLTNENLKQIHADAQQILPKVLNSDGVSTSPSDNLLELDSSADLDISSAPAGLLILTPEFIEQELLKPMKIEGIPRKNIEEALKSASDGTLLKNILNFLNEVEKMQGGLTPKNLVQKLHEIGINQIDADTISMFAGSLNTIGTESVDEVAKTVKELTNFELLPDEIAELLKKNAKLVPKVTQNPSSDFKVGHNTHEIRVN